MHPDKMKELVEAAHLWHLCLFLCPLLSPFSSVLAYVLVV